MTPIPTPVVPTVGLDTSQWIALLSLVLNGFMIWYIMSRNKDADSKEIRKDLEAGVLRINNELIAVRERLAVMESKVGLFYGGVEEFIPKMLSKGFNPIELTEQEQVAYGNYTVHKASTDTQDLRILENALDRELSHRKEIPRDEALLAWLMLQAIKAQLVDRGVTVNKTSYGGTANGKQ